MQTFPLLQRTAFSIVCVGALLGLASHASAAEDGAAADVPPAARSARAVGGSLTLLGSLLWISSSRAGAYPILTLFGLAALGAGIAGFVLAPSTEITSASGQKLTRRSPLRLGSEGLLF